MIGKNDEVDIKYSTRSIEVAAVDTQTHEVRKREVWGSNPQQNRAVWRPPAITNPPKCPADDVKESTQIRQGHRAGAEVPRCFLMTR